MAGKKKVVKRVAGVFSDAGKAAKARAKQRSKEIKAAAAKHAKAKKKASEEIKVLAAKHAKAKNAKAKKKTKEVMQAASNALKKEVKAAKRGETTIPKIPSKVATAAPYVGIAGITGVSGARVYNAKKKPTKAAKKK